MFLINRGDIQGRLDAIYYSASNSLKIANETAYPIKKLSDIAILQRGRFSHRPRNDERFYHGNYPFIQTGDIVRASENNDTILFTQTLNELGLSVSKLFQANTLIITIAANIGDTAILTYPACFPDSLVTITPKNEWVDVRYLNVYFKYVKDYLVNLAPQAAQKNINLQQLSPTPIVIPPKEIQTEIISIFETAYNAKKQKETQAAELLASIDGYLLDALGITLPPPSDKKTYFMSNSKQVSGGRFDPFYHQDEFEKKIECINNGFYPTIPIKKSLSSYKKGIEVGSNEYTDSGIPFIRVSDISNFGLDYQRADKKISTFLYETLRKNYQPELNEILYSKDGTIGFCCVLNDVKDCITSGAILRLQANNEIINTHYLSYILSCNAFRELAERVSIGAVIKHLTLNDWLNTKIPLPPLEKQTEIADHIRAIRAKAKQLQHEAKAELEQAKKTIEKMILGEQYE